jgi:hypothetical protein
MVRVLFGLSTGAGQQEIAVEVDDLVLARFGSRRCSLPSNSSTVPAK